MRRILVVALASILTASPALFAAESDILNVLPEKTLLVVVAKSPETMERHVASLAEAVADVRKRKYSLLDRMLYPYELHHSGLFMDELDGKDPLEGLIDRGGPMAFVMTGGFGMTSGVPVGMVVRVTDYAGLLKKMAERAGAAAPEVTAYGSDVVRGGFDSVFARRLGDFAVFSKSETAVRFFKDPEGRSLAEANPCDFRRTCDACDLAIYLDADGMLKANAFLIGVIRMAQQQQARAGNEAMGEPVDPEEAARRQGRELDLMLEWAGQVDALVAGVDFSAKGIRSSILAAPRDRTKLQRLVKLLEPARFSLVEALPRAEFLAAGAWHVPPELMKLVNEIEMEYARQDGEMTEEELAEHEKYLEDVRRSESGETAFVWSAYAEDQPIFRLMALSAMKRDGETALRRRDFRKEFDREELPGFDLDWEVQIDAERHRDRSIDRMSLAFRASDRTRGEIAGIMRAMFGEKLVIFAADVPGASISAIGYEDSAVVRTQIDRMLDEEPGGLVRTDAWKDAVDGLPAERSGVIAFSMAELMKIVPPMFARMGGGAPTLGRVNLATPSAMGLSWAPSSAGLQFHLNVPVQEMRNIRKALDDLSRTVRDGGDDMRHDPDRLPQALDHHPADRQQ